VVEDEVHDSNDEEKVPSIEDNPRSHTNSSDYDIDSIIISSKDRRC